MKKDTLILIPAYNEAGTIGETLEGLAKSGVEDFANILVINDASADETAVIVYDHRVNVVTHVFNLGYGSALQLGYKYAMREGYEYVIQMDADGQHDVSNVRQIYEALHNGEARTGKQIDIVIGSRFLESSQSFPISWVKKIAIRYFRWLIHLFSGGSVTDPTSGLQGLNRAAFGYYSRFMHFNSTYPDANMITQMQLLGFNVSEIPSVMHERQQGVSMHSGLMKQLLYMLLMTVSVITVWWRCKKKGRE